MQNEQQQIVVTQPPTFGSYRLTFAGQQTAAIAYNATAAQVQQALEQLPNVGTDEQQQVQLNSFDGGTFTLTYAGQTTGPIAAGSDPTVVQTALENLANLAPGDVAVTRGTPTGVVNEEQILDLANPQSGTFTLSFKGQTTGPLAANSSTSTIQAALESLSTIGTNNVLVAVDTVNPGPGRLRVTFTNALGGLNQPLLTLDSTNLNVSGGTPSTSTSVNGQTGTDTYVVTFMGAQAGVNEPQMTVDVTALTGAGHTGAVTTLVQGQPDIVVTGQPLSAGGPLTFDFGGQYANRNVPLIQVQRLSDGSYNAVTTQSGTTGDNLQGVTFAPQQVENGAYANVLFVTNNVGTIYAVYAQDGVGAFGAPAVAGAAVPIFYGGRTQVSTGIGNQTAGAVNGLAFGTLQQNLWHVTDNRRLDAGHGVAVPVTSSRNAVIGGSSFYFGNDYFNNVNGTSADVAGNKNNLGAGAQNTINFPGGAAGSLVSKEFSLEGYSAADRPALYFNYFLQTEGKDFSPGDNNEMRDAFRVFVAGDDGNWSLVSTNDSYRDNQGADEFDYAKDGSFSSTFPNGRPEPEVQESFETANWRQVRADLSDFVGQRNLRLRFDFSTAASTGLGSQYSGGHDGELRAVRGWQLRDGQTLTIADPRSGQNRVFEIDLGTTLIAQPGAAIADGQGFTVRNATTNAQRVFEFDKDGVTAAGAIAIGITDADTANDVAAKISAALNANSGALGGLTTYRNGPEAANNGTQVWNRVNVQAANDANLVFTVTPGLQGLNAGGFVEGKDGLGNANNVRVRVNQNMTRDQVAAVLRRQMADAYFDNAANPLLRSQANDTPGQAANKAAARLALVKASNDLITLIEQPGFGQNSNPIDQFDGGALTGLAFGFDASLPGDSFGSFNVGRNTNEAQSFRGAANNVEGVYVDDLIIGFSERGELVTGAPTDNANFVSNLEVNRAGLTLSNPYQDVLVGPYQVELRRASYYGKNNTSKDPTDTAASFKLENTFDTNFRFSNGTRVFAKAGREIVDGSTFTLSDGIQNAVVFQFVNTEAHPGFQASNTAGAPVTIFYNTVNTSDQIAAAIVAAVNQNGGAVQSSLRGISATIGSGSVTPDGVKRSDTGVTLTGTALVTSAAAGLTYETNGSVNGSSFPFRPSPYGETQYFGDRNRERQQGQLVIEQNQITYTGGTGIRVSALDGSAASPLPATGAPINFPVLNSDALAAGVVIQNNVVGYFGTDGVQINGSPTQPSATTVPFARIVNNTFYGQMNGALPGAGIHVQTNAAATALNNIVANTNGGIVVDASSANLTVVGSTVFKGNNANGTTGSNSTLLGPADPLFTNPGRANFYLASGSQAIDSSLNALGDRQGLVNVKSPLEIPPSNIVAPQSDAFGQARVDDPNVASPPGLGSNVFRDRGAIERADFSGPTANLLVPTDNGAGDLNPAVNAYRSYADAPGRLIVQLADVGIGIDDATITPANFVLTYRAGDPSIPATLGAPVVLTPGADYLFRYDANTKQVQLLSTAARFAYGSYDLTLSRSATGVADLAGNAVQANRQSDPNDPNTAQTAFTFEFIPPPQISVDTGASIVESDSGTTTLNFTVRLSKPLLAGQTISFDVATLDGTAVGKGAARDYVPLLQRVTFTAGGPLTQTIGVQIVGDLNPEPTETVILSLSNVSGPAEIGTAIGVGTIIDNDNPPVAVSSPQIVEGDSGTKNLVFTLTLQKAIAGPVTVGYATADGTATAGQDYTAVTGTVVFPAGTTTQTVSVPILGDIALEGDETFRLLLTSVVNGTIGPVGNPTFGTGTILNDDTPGVSVSDAVKVPEGTDALFTVSLSKAISNVPVTVVVTTIDATATAASGDYTPVNRTLTFAPGQTSMTVAVSTLFDGLTEPTETFGLKIVSVTNGTIADGVGTGFIGDGTPTLTVANVTAAEGAQPATFTLRLSKPVNAPVTVNYTTSDGSANAGLDYTAATGTVTFAANQTTATLAVPTLYDNLAEGSETFFLNLSGATNVTLGTTRATATILDTTPVLTVANVTAAEGDQPATFTLRLSKPVNTPVTVNYATSDGSATAGSDYSPRTGTVTFAANQTSATVVVPTLFDNLLEGNETFFLNLSSPTNASLGTTRATATILDGTPTLTVGNISVLEGDTARFTVTLSQASQVPVTVQVQTADGTADSRNDYNALQTTTLTFSPAGR